MIFIISFGWFEKSGGVCRHSPQRKRVTLYRKKCYSEGKCVQVRCQKKIPKQADNLFSFLNLALLALLFPPRASHTTTGIRRITIDEHPLKSSSNMVIKTQLCAFSENRIYPGHGSMCCRRDGQTFWLGTKKAKSMYNQRKKPQKLAWTQAWRRLHKKNIDNRQKKKVSSSNSSDHHMMMTIVAVWF